MCDMELFETGQQLLLEHFQTGLSLHLLVEQKGKVYLLARTRQPYNRLQCSPQKVGTLLWKPTRLNANAAAMWHVERGDLEHAGAHEELSSHNLLRIRSAASFLGEVNCLSFSDTGELVLTRDTQSLWRHVQAPPILEGWSASSAPPASSQPSALKSTLTSTQSLLPSPRCHGVEHHAPGVTHPVDATWPVAASVALREQGYVVLSSLIPPRKVARALQYMNHHLGSANLSADLDPSGLGSEFYGPPGGDASDPNSPTGGSQVVKLGAGHACTCSLAQSAPLLDMLGPTERQQLAQMVLQDRKISSMFGCQVALRFPMSPSADAVGGVEALPGLMRKLTWHNDADKYNDKKQFDLVVGIFLSPIRSVTDGCLWVRPGSHKRPPPSLDERAHEANDADTNARQNNAYPDASVETTSHETGDTNNKAATIYIASCGTAGHDSVLTTTTTTANAADDLIGSRSHSGGNSRSGVSDVLVDTPILAPAAGTVIVFDKFLEHAGGPNIAETIRYACYYRLRFER